MSPAMRTMAAGGSAAGAKTARQKNKRAKKRGRMGNRWDARRGADGGRRESFSEERSFALGIISADEGGAALPAGAIGRLLVRGCSNFGGYLQRPQWNNTDAEGWFDTGDLARMDEAGYIRISGRSKDVIIRGGENIPVVEIESLLYRHPAVAQVAIVAYADERLGERACAVVVPKPGQSLDFAGMVAFLKEQKVAVQYIPERLVVRDAMPATPSGKIQKFRLREMLRDGSL